LNGMENSAGDCLKHSRMIEMCVGRCQNEEQIWLTRSPHKYDVLKTGFLYKISNSKTKRYYYGSTFYPDERLKTHRENYEKDNAECESFQIYQDGKDTAKEEIVGKVNYYFACKGCRGCKKGLCEDWTDDLKQKEGELILLSSNDPLCVNIDQPFKNYVINQ